MNPNRVITGERRERSITPLILGVGSLAAPIGFLLIVPARENSRIFQHIGYYVIIWHAFLILGGALVLAGWWKRKIELEAAGYILASTGAFLYTIAAFATVGWAAWFSGVLIASLAGGQICRAVAAMQGRSVS